MNSTAFYQKPTWRRRIWRKLGFVYHLGADPTPEEIADRPGWMTTESSFRFGWCDRLRLLLTGRLNIKLVQHTEVQVEGTRNRLDWWISAPGER